MLNVFEGRYEIFDLDRYLNISKNDQRRAENMMKESSMLIIMMHILVCYRVNLT